MSYTISSRTERAHEKATTGAPFRGYATVGIAPDEEAYAALMAQDAQDIRSRNRSEDRRSSVQLSIFLAMGDEPRTVEDIANGAMRSPEQVRKFLQKRRRDGMTEVVRFEKPWLWVVTPEGRNKIKELLNPPEYPEHSCKICGALINKTSISRMCTRHVHHPGCECKQCDGK